MITDGIQLLIVNNCKESIWPGILGNAGHPTPKDGGFHLSSGEQLILDVPEGWSGRIWGRQGCCFDGQTDKGSCQTGDCGGPGIPPATLVEMTLGTSQSDLHFYDVSLVDGFNLPMSMKAVGGGLGCGVAACEADLNVYCPYNLAVVRERKLVGCKSACLAAKSDRYCCTGYYADPRACKPTLFGHLFKVICPQAYSFAFDNSGGIKTCKAFMYVITFCPSI